MLIGDVGQNLYEEVDYQPPATGGSNYGWRVTEGEHPYDPSLGPAYLPLVGPIAASTDHTVGNSITGGFVYRGASLGAFYRGRYFYADFVTARVWCDRIDSSRERRSNGVSSHRAHRRPWWLRRARQHQRVRHGCRGRVVHRQLLVRTDFENRHSHDLPPTRLCRHRRRRQGRSRTVAAVHGRRGSSHPAVPTVAIRYNRVWGVLSVVTLPITIFRSRATTHERRKN